MDNRRKVEWWGRARQRESKKDGTIEIPQVA